MLNGILSIEHGGLEKVDVNEKGKSYTSFSNFSPIVVGTEESMHSNVSLAFLSLAESCSLSPKGSSRN